MKIKFIFKLNWISYSLLYIVYLHKDIGIAKKQPNCTYIWLTIYLPNNCKLMNAFFNIFKKDFINSYTIKRKLT